MRQLRVGWKVAPLGSLVDTLVPMRDKPDDLSGDIPWIRIEDFVGKEISGSKSAQGVSHETVREMHLRIFPPGTVLCSCSCSMGVTAVVTKPLVSNQTFIGLVPRPGLALSDFLYYALQAVREELNVRATGAIQQYLSRDDFRQFRLPIPPLDEQRSIALFLDAETARIDALIEKKRRMIDLLALRRQTLIDQAMLDRGSRQTEGTLTRANLRALGLVPFKYSVGLQEGPGIMAEDFRDEGTPLLRVGNLVEDHVELDGCNFLDPVAVECRWSHFMVRRSDLLISASASMGQAVRADAKVEGAIPYTGIIRVWPRGDNLDREYLRVFLLSRLFLDQIEALKTGIAIQHFGPTHLGQLLMPLPARTEQEEIVRRLDGELDRLRTLTERLDRQIILLIERREALVTVAVTGELGVVEAT